MKQPIGSKKIGNKDLHAKDKEPMKKRLEHLPELPMKDDYKANKSMRGSSAKPNYNIFKDVGSPPQEPKGGKFGGENIDTTNSRGSSARNQPKPRKCPK